MAKTINIDKEKNELMLVLQKAVQSANLNFLIGSGCSYPALEVRGDIEKQVDEKIKAGDNEEAEKIIFKYLKPFVKSYKRTKNDSKDKNHKQTFNNYMSFIGSISKILFERKSNILPKQATIFSTNYDLFIEKASERFSGSLILNDGFNRNPTLDNKFKFSITEFFNSIYS